MSQCEDVELKDLVTEALEKNGVLAKIRAQLRANIFMTLEDEHSQKHQNPKLKSVTDTRDGFLALILIQEMLDYCNLIQTSSVFKSETDQGKTYFYEGRDAMLAKLFKFTNISCDIPVLVHVIKLLFEIKVINENVSHFEEKSFESDGVNMDTQNNTFVVNSGRSDNYDLSFVSDADTSGSSSGEKKKLSDSSTTSNDSISTELNGEKARNSQIEDELKSVSKNQDISIENESNSSKIISEVLQSDESSPERTKTSEINKNNNKTYSQYLKDKQNKDNNHKQLINNKQEGSEPVDIVMRHIIQSRIHGGPTNESTGEESLSEELRAFEKSEKNSEDSNGLPETSLSLDIISDDNSLKTDDSVSPVRNILDESLPESPKTKQKVADGINNLKMQSLRITDDDQIIFSDDLNDIKLKFRNLKNTTTSKDVLMNNEKNKKAATKSLNKEKGINTIYDNSGKDQSSLPLFTTSPNKEALVDGKVSVIVSTDKIDSIKGLKNS